jgi:predicted amidohydrolase YtcJ
LTRAGGHSIVGNSMALKIAGIDRNTPDPKAGLIEHDARGEPNGILRESDPFEQHVPQAKFEDLRSGYIASLKHLFALGITSFESASTTIDDEPLGQGASPIPDLD